MDRSISRDAARVAALIIVLALAATFGLAVGEMIRGNAGTGAAAPDAGDDVDWGTEGYLDYGQRLAMADAAIVGTPSYADPHLGLIRQYAASEGPQQTDPRPHIWAEIDDDGDVADNLRRHVLRRGAEPSGPEQTDPRPHIWAEIDDDASDVRNDSLTRPMPR
jgi:hypothetical protein